MRIFPAGFWPALVHGAIVIGAQERAWRALEHIVTVFIDPKVLLNKVTRSHPQRLGYTLNIRFVKNGAGGLAAIGARQTVDFAEHLFVNGVKDVVDLPGVFLFQTGEKLFVFRLPVLGF